MGKSFKSNKIFGAFEENYHNINLGSSYLTGKVADMEIMKNISLSERFKKLPNHWMKLLWIIAAFYLMEHVDEKELFIMKTCVQGKATFNVMLLKEPDECNVDSINKAMKNSLIN